MCVRVYVFVYMYVCVYIYVCMCVGVYVCVCVCIHICMYVSMYVCINDLNKSPAYIHYNYIYIRYSCKP